jgi:hypothetical protein
MNQQIKSSQLLLTMNFHDDAMMLNEGILEALGRPRQVQIMLNEEAKRLLLRPCEVDSKQAVVIPAEHVLQVEIGARQLLRKIRKIAGWDTEQPRICVGERIEDYQAVFFDLARSIAVSPGLAADPA